MDTTLQAAVHFFKNEQGYNKLFKLFRKKYESLGRVGGTIPVTSFSETELNVIGAFFGKSAGQLQEKGNVSMRAFEMQLQETRFAVDLLSLLGSYFGENIVSKKVQEQERQASLHVFFYEIKSSVAPVIAFWIDYLLENRGDGRWIIQMAEKDEVAISKMFTALNHAYTSLPTSPERLPMFSQRITGDPHAFDGDEDLGKMWLHLLAVAQAYRTQIPVQHPVSTEDVNALYESFHIYRDDLLNFVTCANLVASDEAGEHPVWKAAAQKHTVQIVPIRELLPLKHLRPGVGNVVFIVENSGVCATLLDHVPHAPMICSNGQFTLATWLILEKLVTSGAVFYYAGDFDPEGLRMADRLVERFGSEAVRLWRMDTPAYRYSEPQKTLRPERLEKLNGLTHHELIEVGAVMRKVGKAGYQEALVDEMVSDLRRI